MDHVGRYTWDKSCWSDDNLSSKRIYPRYQFSAKSKKWLPRLLTSEGSMILMVQHMQETHALRVNKGVDIEKVKKLDLASVETIAERAAAVYNLAQELSQEVPIARKVIEDQWLHAWVEGNTQIDHEVQSLLLDKKDAFDIKKDVPTFRALCDAHIQSKPLPDNNTDPESLEVDRFHLMMKQLQYDQAVFEGWLKKCQAVQRTRDSATHTWRLEQQELKTQLASNLFAGTSKLLIWDVKRPEQTIGELMGWKRTISAKLGADPSLISNLTYLNYAVPALIPSACERAQQDVLSWALTEQMQSMGIVLSPVYSYGKRIFQEEKKMAAMLERGSFNFDWNFSLLFKGRSDMRDMRPLNMQGRLLYPAAFEVSKNIFFGSALRKRQRTDEIEQLSVANMRTIEDLNPDSLPASTDSKFVHGANKYAQIGIKAAEAMLQGSLSEINLAQLQAVLVVDLFPHTGDMLYAFLKQRRMHKFQVFYAGVCQDQNELSWLERNVIQHVLDGYKDGSIPLPQNTKVTNTMPDDLVEAMPSQPQLNQLVITDNELACPSTLVKEWQTHAVFGPQFSQWLDTFCERYTVIDKTAAAEDILSMILFSNQQVV